jgi:hypothetical protein
MDAQLFSKALGELATLRYAGRVELYVYNEPLRDMGWAVSCIAATRATVPHACIMLATNGDYLKRARQIMELYDAGLNQLLINCYSAGLYDQRAAMLSTLPSSIERDGPIYSGVGPRRRTLQLQDKSDIDRFGSGVFRLVNRAGNVPAFTPACTQPVQRMCAKPFRMLNINWRGDALVCCQDYHAQVSYGNLRNSTLVELWQHPVMNEYRRHLYGKDRSLPLCCLCDCHAGAYPHMVEAPCGPYANFDSIERLARKRGYRDQP